MRNDIAMSSNTETHSLPPNLVVPNTVGTGRCSAVLTALTNEALETDNREKEVFLADVTLGKYHNPSAVNLLKFYTELTRLMSRITREGYIRIHYTIVDFADPAWQQLKSIEEGCYNRLLTLAEKGEREEY